VETNYHFSFLVYHSKSGDDVHFSPPKLNNPVPLIELVNDSCCS